MKVIKEVSSTILMHNVTIDTILVSFNRAFVMNNATFFLQQASLSVTKTIGNLYTLF